ncbi:hypothetical protein [Polyangium aurulentum]|uniref:hypothetical protein n=1 Tax=Polyangium aurulentum TaxID=2567896 RepID=UPI0010AEE676|nr:hypothetical protein [Polyangium aurulentum]UQA58260.1 hypothetical protein E8A73_044605 [Polyangium aurulentum]
MPPPDRLEALATRAPPGSLEQRLAREVSGAQDAEAQVAALNDVLLEVDHALEASAGWPRAGTRIAAYGGMLLVIIAVISRAGPVAYFTLLALVLIATLASAAVGARARDLGRAQRKDLDALIDAVYGRMPKGAPRAKRRR